MIRANGSDLVQQPIILTTNGLQSWATFFIKLISCRKSCLSSPPAPSMRKCCVNKAVKVYINECVNLYTNKCTQYTYTVPCIHNVKGNM